MNPEKIKELKHERDHAHKSLLDAPSPLLYPDRSGDWLEQAQSLVMEYGEWYENSRATALSLIHNGKL